MRKPYRWTVTPPRDANAVSGFAAEIGIPELIARILLNREIDTYEKARQFFKPGSSDLHDPFLMDGMLAAVERIMSAIDRREKILIFGDYDVDGTNSAAMLHLFVKSLDLESIVHIPDRVKEGYGLSETGIDRGCAFGATLLIAIDCGITAAPMVEYARKVGIDVIICDHHEPGDTLPAAVAVLDPLKPSCGYPFKHLCGCGVGFKLIQAILGRLGRGDEASGYLDFATLATTADIVPLVGENRNFARTGLEKLNKNPRPGMKALIRSAGIENGDITTGQIVFILAPRINAVGRMGDATRAVDLLTCEDAGRAAELAGILEAENLNRRKVDELTFAEAMSKAEAMMERESMPAVVLHDANWHPGVLGIVASRMVEKYYKPSIMLTEVDGVLKGSARSIVGFDIHNALKEVEHTLLTFGGHKYAAGLSVDSARIDEFRTAFNRVVEKALSEEMKQPELRIDADVRLGEITGRVIKILKEFAPYGPGNMRPVFQAIGVEVSSNPRIVGKDHLRFKVRQDGNEIDTIGFNLGTLLGEVGSAGDSVDIVFSVDEHEWSPSKGQRPAYANAGSRAVPQPDGAPAAYPQLKIKDIRKHRKGE